MSYSVVWFKRDLRLHDHAALADAARHGPLLCLYVIEPSMWRQPDAARQHYEFLLECLQDLDTALQAQGGRLHVQVGEVCEVLAQLHQVAPFHRLCAHEETGNAWSFERDKAVARWCRQAGVAWHEQAQFGVVRRLRSRDQWLAHWQDHMAAPCAPVPTLVFQCPPGAPHTPPTAQALGLNSHTPRRRQRGGRALGLRVLASFLDSRSAQYRGGISSPLSAPSACSRLSPYLALGCLSMREVVQNTRQHIDMASPASSRHTQGLSAFLSRLHWHCHFIQKLESEPAIEWRNMHRGYDGLREDAFNASHFDALTQARTGWPMVDACVVMLRETGWLNFRMRAMLVSVAAYPLWLHWRPVGCWLAQQFLDYEPGIHWSQLQMQSGTTGINTTRVYNPIKQAQDHDPQGRFVRQWLPAMRQVPDAWLFEPWRMPPEVQARCGVVVGRDIPMPLVDLAQATREAKTRLHSLRAQAHVKADKAAIVEKHGSRRKTGRQRTTTPATVLDSPQLKLEF